MRLVKLVFTVTIVNIFALSFSAAQVAPERILLNGKIATVDDFFSIQEAVALQGERILAVGSNEDMESLAGPDTEIVDLGGKTVIPGLIDDHNHVVRATEYWPNEARLDGVTTRGEALQILQEKAASLAPGEWLMSLGGWSEVQFAGDRSDFTLAELDAVAPDRPAFIQSVYHHAFGNTAWFEAMDIPLVARDGEQQGSTEFGASVLRDANGRVTGRLNGGFPMIELALQSFPEVSSEQQTDAIVTAFEYLNSIGLTTVYDPAGVGIRRESYTRLREIADDQGLTVRIFHTLGGSMPRTPQDARDLILEIRNSRPFQGDAFVDLIAVGEIWFAPFHWDSTLGSTEPTVDDTSWARQIMIAAAEGGWSLQPHATQPTTIAHVLDLITQVNSVQPMRQLRWSIAHADNITAEQLDRARHLGMNILLRSNMVMNDRQPVFDAFGDAAYDMPPLRMIQDSGVTYGLGTDGTKAAQINPFVTLWWAVTGKALNGDVIQHQTLTREEALLAHTRGNALAMFQEQNLGAIKPGLLADMLVLDRDYLTVPADEIKDIRPGTTSVGGQVGYGEL